MQILAAGGIPVLTDKSRAADVNNLRGYFEYEPVKSLMRDGSWLGSAARGKAVKIITQLLPSIPSGVPCRILMMDRPLAEVLESQDRMLRELGRPPAKSRELLAQTFSRQRETVLQEMRSRSAVAMLDVSYHALVARDPSLIDAIAEFVGWPGLDQAAMLAAIDPGLYRSRSLGEGAESIPR